VCAPPYHRKSDGFNSGVNAGWAKTCGRSLNSFHNSVEILARTV
jgi:hypothetical protein